MLEQVARAYDDAVYDTDRVSALRAVYEAVAGGVSPEDIVFKVVLPSLEKTVKAISENDTANLAQHFLASQIAAAVVEEMAAKFKRAPATTGVVVIGTPPGDFHSLGKRIVTGCLRALFIDVVDLGVNVPPERFVEEAVARGAQVIAISSMMVHTARGDGGCRKVRQLLRERRLEDKVKIIVGGAPYRFDPELYHTVQADAWAENGIEAGETIVRLIREVKTC